ncbi:unnamed protein product [Somion occarium]|uniref:Uncharacterized protein n=1 Tax=Somion occarium TaxID=3059160 RepID=A0ABP1CS91_9APHY
MFFSPKLLYPVFAVISVASTAFASPVAAPVAELVTRQSDLVSEIQSFQSTVSPLIDQLSQAAATGADPSPAVDQLSSAFSDSTNSFKSKKGAILADVDVTVFLDVSLDIVVKLVVALSKFPLLDLFLSAKVDVILSAWISALGVVSPGIAPKIGKGIPTADIGIFAILKLLLSAKVLAIVDLLGIIKL